LWRHPHQEEFHAFYASRVLGYRNKDREMSGACGTNRKSEKYIKSM